MPSSPVASRTSRASVSGSKPGREATRVAIENATYRTSQPPSTSRAIVPPQPSSPSSVCGASTSAFFQASITAPFNHSSAAEIGPCGRFPAGRHQVR
jgi:hypothetical protein